MKGNIEVMSKADFLRKCCENNDDNLTRQVMASAYDTICQTAVECLKDKTGVQIHGLGMFLPEVKPSRKARNPATGETVTVPPRLGVRFKMNANFRAALKSIDVSKKARKSK